MSQELLLLLLLLLLAAVSESLVSIASPQAKWRWVSGDETEMVHYIFAIGYSTICI